MGKTFSTMMVAGLLWAQFGWANPPGADPVVNDAVEQDIQGLIKLREHYQQKYGQVEALTPSLPQIPQMPDLAQLQQIQQLQPLLSNPYFMKAVRVFSDPKTSELMKKLLSHPNRHHVLYFELGWILLIMLFKTWFSTRPMGLFRRFLGNLGISLVFWLGGVTVVPWLVFRDLYVEFVRVIAAGFGWQI